MNTTAQGSREMRSHPGWIDTLRPRQRDNQMEKHEYLKGKVGTAKANYMGDRSVRNEVSLREAEQNLHSFQNHGFADMIKDSPTHFTDGVKARKEVVQERDAQRKMSRENSRSKDEIRAAESSYQQAKRELDIYSKRNSAGLDRERRLLEQSRDPSLRPTRNIVPEHREVHAPAVAPAPVQPPVAHMPGIPGPARELRVRNRHGEALVPPDYRDAKNYHEDLTGAGKSDWKQRLNTDNRTGRDLTREAQARAAQDGAAQGGKLKKKETGQQREVRQSKADMKRADNDRSAGMPTAKQSFGDKMKGFFTRKENPPPNDMASVLRELRAPQPPPSWAVDPPTSLPSLTPRNPRSQEPHDSGSLYAPGGPGTMEPWNTPHRPGPDEASTSSRPRHPPRPSSLGRLPSNTGSLQDRSHAAGPSTLRRQDSDSTTSSERIPPSAAFLASLDRPQPLDDRRPGPDQASSSSRPLPAGRQPSNAGSFDAHPGEIRTISMSPGALNPQDLASSGGLAPNSIMMSYQYRPPTQQPIQEP